MARLIDADALVEMVKRHGCDKCPGGALQCTSCTLNQFIAMIDSTPTIDAAPVRRGEWEGRHGDKMIAEDTYRHYHYYICNLCYKRTAVRSSFCPNCGASMRGT